MEIQKKYLNYVFHVEVDRVGEHVNRDIIIDSNDSLASLAYIILASVNAMSHHMFKLNVKYNTDVSFVCILLKDFQEKYIEEYLARDYLLWKFHLEEGDVIELDYGFGGGWHFTAQLIERKVEDTRYVIPEVIKGNGYGIVEDGTIELLKNIFENGKKFDNLDYSLYVNDNEKNSDNFKVLKLIYERVEEA